MKVATARDKPEWYPVPPGVVSARVCRLSGKLATDGCEHVPVVTKAGAMEMRSMAYYEYFARGTEPTQTCPLHGSPSILNRIVGLFGGNSNLPPVPEAAAPPPTPTTPAHAPPSATAGQQPGAAAQAQAEQPKKRGFWSKLFGLGKKKDDKKQDQKKDEQKK
jgi:hypothetical protein